MPRGFVGKFLSAGLLDGSDDGGALFLETPSLAKY